jgi:WD40 repeat protein
MNGVQGRIWDASTGRVRHSFDEPILRMSADGRWLALQGDKVIAIRHLHTGRLLANVSGAGPVSGGNDGSQGQLVFSPDGSLLAVRAESRHEVGLWDTFTGQRVCRFVEPLARIHSFAFAPDGRTVVLAFRDGGSLLVCDVTGMATAAGKFLLCS